MITGVSVTSGGTAACTDRPRSGATNSVNFLANMTGSERTPREGAATPELARLYGAWADGGMGVCVTGNVMIDRGALGEPGNVVIEDAQHLAALKAWARAAIRNGTQCWVQLNHPGRQAPRGLNRETVAPSAVPFRQDMQAFFATPRALTRAEVRGLINRFGKAARIVKKAGFTGVQIHGAHGYLVSQFLSPHSNQRTDDWGGTPEKRRRFVLAVYQAMRKAVGPDFPIGIKLNSADFQRGGFTEEESLDTIRALAAAGPRRAALLGWALWAAAHAAHAATPVAPVPVRVDSLQATRAEDATRLRAWWYPVVAARPAPAVVLLHGCGGMLNARGEPSAKTREYADLLNGQGWQVLALDSLTARGEKELCTQRIDTRRITQTERRKDALGALQWLSAQPQVDASRLAADITRAVDALPLDCVSTMAYTSLFEGYSRGLLRRGRADLTNRGHRAERRHPHGRVRRGGPRGARGGRRDHRRFRSGHRMAGMPRQGRRHRGAHPCRERRTAS